MRAQDMGAYFRGAADNRDLNYDKYFVQGELQTETDASYTSHNTRLLTTDETVQKLLTTDYVRTQLAEVRGE